MSDLPVASRTVAQFLDALGSKTPSPGGGAVSALSGALGAAQMLMVAEYAKWEPADPDPRSRLKALVQDLLGLAEADAVAYAVYSRSRARRKEDPAQYAQAQLGITEVPAGIVERCVEAGEFAPDVLVRAPKWFAGDMLVAATCLETGAAGALALCGANLDSLPADVRQGFAKRLKDAHVRLERARRRLEPLLLPRLPAN